MIRIVRSKPFALTGFIVSGWAMQEGRKLDSRTYYMD